MKSSDPTSPYNQTFNSRAAAFESFLRWARERLAKQDARARTRSSSGAFACECAELPTESRELSAAARRCGCRAGTARLLFFCRRFLFQIKRKCRNTESVYHLIIMRSEGRSRLSQFITLYRLSPITDSRKGCPYEVRRLKIVQISGLDVIRPYRSLFLLFTFTYYFKWNELTRGLGLHRVGFLYTIVLQQNPRPIRL